MSVLVLVVVAKMSVAWLGVCDASSLADRRRVSQQGVKRFGSARLGARSAFTSQRRVTRRVGHR